MAKKLPLDDETWLVLNAQGTEGAFALSCALGLHRLPACIDAAYERAEWVDVLAKMRGMGIAHTLYRFPVVRQICGCRVCVDPCADDEHHLANLVVRLCSGHQWADTEGQPRDVLPLGFVVARSKYRESHGERRG